MQLTNLGYAVASTEEAVHKQSVSFTESAFAFARQLVEEGERRLRLPVDQWAPVGALEEVTRGARVYRQELAESKDEVPQE